MLSSSLIEGKINLLRDLQNKFAVGILTPTRKACKIKELPQFYKRGQKEQEISPAPISFQVQWGKYRE